MKIYLAGPMTGLPKFNAPAFKAMEIALSAKGHTVMNPANHIPICNPEAIAYEKYLALGLFMIEICDAIFLLKGWETSKGARLERIFAEQRNKLIMEE